MKLSSWYDYSQVVYVDMVTDVIIGCPIHGYFKQNPYRHKMGANCPYCSGNYRFNPKSEEETKEYWLENGVTGDTSWYKHWSGNNLQDHGFPYSPWCSYKMTRSKWSEYVFGRKKTKEETKEYWLDNGITGESSWRKHWKGNNLQEHGYISQPGKFFRMSCLDWTEYVCGKKKTREETKEYWIKHKITGSKMWHIHRKDNNLQGHDYLCNPWMSFKMIIKEWVEYVCGKKEIKSKEETKKYWLDNEITGSSVWTKHWKNSNVREQGYLCSPWMSFKMTAAKWTEYVWGKTK